jgi:dihydrodiol dehydrogenase / D-xylose 1-dehydrogenase (NADP)
MRWAIVSTGRISQDFARALLIAGSTVAAVSSRSQDAVDAFGKQFGVGARGRFVGVEAMVAANGDGALFDVVYVATPHASHVHDTLLALNCRCPVLCEKPMVVSAPQLIRCISVAREKRVFLSEGMWTRCFPLTRELHELINVKKSIGHVRHVSGTFGWYDSLQQRRMTELIDAGGALLEVGVYLLFMASLGLGGFHNHAPTRVHATAVLGSTGCDMQTNMAIECPGGVTADLMCSFLSPLPNEFLFYGTHGTIRVHDAFHAPTVATIALCDRDKFGVVHTRVANHPIDGAQDADSKAFNFHNSRGLVYEIQAVESAIASGKLELDEVPLAESLAIAKIMDQVRAQIGVAFGHVEH